MAKANNRLVVKMDEEIPPITINKQRRKRTGFSYDDNEKVIRINYDILALDSDGNEIYKFGQDVKEIYVDRFEETHITKFLTELDLLSNTEL